MNFKTLIFLIICLFSASIASQCHPSCAYCVRFDDATACLKCSTGFSFPALAILPTIC